MSAVGTLVFCTDCGNLLDGSTGNKKAILTCDCCGAKNRDTSSKVVITRSKDSSFPSLLRQKHSAVQTVQLSDRKTEAIVQQQCPECGRPEMKYYALQLRSADEGTTVFYSCECGYKETTNN